MSNAIAKSNRYMLHLKISPVLLYCNSTMMHKNCQWLKLCFKLYLFIILTCAISRNNLNSDLSYRKFSKIRLGFFKTSAILGRAYFRNMLIFEACLFKNFINFETLFFKINLIFWLTSMYSKDVYGSITNTIMLTNLSKN